MKYIIVILLLCAVAFSQSLVVNVPLSPDAQKEIKEKVEPLIPDMIAPFRGTCHKVITVVLVVRDGEQIFLKVITYCDDKKKVARR